MKDKIKELEKREIAIRKQKNNLIEKKRQEVYIPKLKTYIGRYFAYRKSCYSCPEKPEDYWDVFYKVIDFIGSEFMVESCEIDSRGKASIKTETRWEYADGRKPFESLEEIKAEEYCKARANTLDEILFQGRLRRVLKED